MKVQIFNHHTDSEQISKFIVNPNNYDYSVYSYAVSRYDGDTYRIFLSPFLLGGEVVRRHSFAEILSDLWKIYNEN